MYRSRFANSAGLAFALLAASMPLSSCAKSDDPSPIESAYNLMTEAMVSRYPACAGKTTAAADGAVSCTVGGHLYLVYAAAPDKVEQTAESLRVLHTTGIVVIDGPRIWVEE